MRFTLVGKNHWKARDKCDTYEIIWHRFIFRMTPGYATFKNDVIWIATHAKMSDAMQTAEIERERQEWQSNNPENQAKNAFFRNFRESQREVVASTTSEKSRTRVRPYKGTIRCEKPKRRYKARLTHV